MPIGTIILIVVAILVYFGLAQRVLDRMRMTDRAALGVIALLIAGSFVNFRLLAPPAELMVNVGGALVPLGVAIWLIVTADEAMEKVRGSLAAVITGVAVYGAIKILNPEEQTMFIDPVFAFAIIAGIVGYLAGRSRRSAFIAGITGVILGDIFHYIELTVRRLPGRTWLGGAGAFDSVVIAGLLAVLLAELVGETRERLAQGNRTGPDREDERGEAT
ncbi:MAG: DUF1614 domain-containing protein [Bacillota bacterium]